MFILATIQSLIESVTTLHIETHFYYLQSLHIITVRAGIYVGGRLFCAYMSDSFRLYKQHPKLAKYQIMAYIWQLESQKTEKVTSRSQGKIAQSPKDPYGI